MTDLEHGLRGGQELGRRGRVGAQVLLVEG